MDELLVQEIIDSLVRMIRQNVTPMSDEEFHNCEVVLSPLSEDMYLIEGTGQKSFKEVQEEAIDLLDRYDLKSAYQELHGLPIRQEEDSLYSPIVQYTTFMDTQSDTGLYSVQKLVVPTSFDSLSPYYLAHEYHHILKEKNPMEYSNKLRYADVIPQFFELIAGESIQDQKDLIHNRLAMMHASRDFIKEHNDRNNRNYLFDLLDSKNCQYLNSFYYSTLLYDYFQDHPYEVLYRIRMVLNREMTTYQMLDTLHFFDSSFDSVVESGIQYLKKYSS